MKELEKIVIEVEKARASGKTAALATVVGIEGSGYRLPGARMLIVDGQWIAGSISGGCLEDDVVLRAGEAIKNAEAVVTTYDTTSDEDIVFGVGLGCKGIIRILIEPIRPTDDRHDFIGFVKACHDQRIAGIVATVVRVDGDVDTKAGCRVLYRAGASITDVQDAALEAKMLAAIARGPSQTTSSIFLLKGTVEVFIERIEPPTPLVIFGAGHDAIPVVRLGKEIGWHVTVFDHRPAYATTARFPLADRIIVATPEQASTNIALTADTLAIIMTHNYLRDAKLLELLLPSPARYVGLLGPKRRADELLADLRERGISVGPEQLSRLYAPVGLDVGSESPAEVALSILAEMQAVIKNRAGGFLRNSRSPIHSQGFAITNLNTLVDDDRPAGDASGHRAVLIDLQQQPKLTLD